MQRVNREEGTAGRIAPRRSFAAKVFVAALVFSSVAASAQTVYKQVDKAGRTTFTDRPVDTASTVAFYMAPSSQSRVPGAPDASSLRAVSAPALPKFATRSQLIDYKEAARRLQQAQRNLELGTEPQLGERTVVDGKSMLNERYRERRESLSREVAAAQARVNEVSTPARVVQSRLPARVAEVSAERQAMNPAGGYGADSAALASRPEPPLDEYAASSAP